MEHRCRDCEKRKLPKVGNPVVSFTNPLASQVRRGTFLIFNLCQIQQYCCFTLGCRPTSSTPPRPFPLQGSSKRLMLLKSSLLDLLKSQMKESGQLSRILRRWLPDSKVHNEDFFVASLLYQLPHRLTALAVASSNQWVWKTQFLLLPSLPPQSLWLSSFSSGNW